MEFYANEIVQDLAHRPYMELGVHSDSDSELANVYSGLETILEETSGEWRCSRGSVNHESVNHESVNQESGTRTDSKLRSVKVLMVDPYNFWIGRADGD